MWLSVPQNSHTRKKYTSVDRRRKTVRPITPTEYATRRIERILSEVSAVVSATKEVLKSFGAKYDRLN